MSNQILMIFVKTDGTHAMFNDVYERIMNICKILNLRNFNVFLNVHLTLTHLICKGALHNQIDIQKYMFH